MASYKIEWKTSAGKELRTLPKAVISEILDRVSHLADDPFPPGIRKLAGAERTYHLRLVHTASYIPFQEITVL
jgi:mRNA-degrading endonuclease RelE of RelBE toxin-antitoxin system